MNATRGVPTVDGEYELLTTKYNGPVARKRHNSYWYFCDGKACQDISDGMIIGYRIHEPMVLPPLKKLPFIRGIERVIKLDSGGGVVRAVKYDNIYIYFNSNGKPLQTFDNVVMEMTQQQCEAAGIEWPF